MKHFIFGICLFFSSILSHAQTTSLVVGNAPGGLVDSSARIVADFLTSKGNKTIVVNKPGAGQVLAANYVAGQKPSDKNILLGTMSNTVLAAIDKTTGSQFDENTFVPVGFIGISPFILIADKKQISSTNLKDFMQEFTKNHAKINFGSTGRFSDLAMKEVMKQTQKPINIVPYKSGSDLLMAVAGGHIQVGLLDLGTALPFIKEDKVIALATTTKNRVSAIPQVMSVHELVKDYMFLGAFLAIFASPGTSIEEAENLNSLLLELNRTPEYKERLDKLFLVNQNMNQKEFSNFYKKQITNFKYLTEQNK